MKRNLLFIVALSMVLVMSGCKSKESAYKLAYEKAKAAEEENPVEEEVVEVVPMVEVPVTETVVVSDEDDAQFVTENLQVVDGDGLKNYSVVVGSFSLKANADGLLDVLRSAGFTPIEAYNEERGMYRVVATTFDTRGEAVYSRDELRGRYPDAWLLYQK